LNAICYLSYDEIRLKIETMLSSIPIHEYDAIVIILRGGSFLGMHLSFLTNLPFYFLSYEKETKTPQWWGHSPSNEQRLLLCEDFAGSGYTLLDCQSFLVAQNYQVHNFVVVVDAWSRVKPNYSCFWFSDPSLRILLPWEKERIYQLANPENSVDVLITGWDFDGIFIEDVPSFEYEENLEQALVKRDTLSLASFAPSLSKRDIIITGRPTQDKERTLHWTSSHHIQNLIIFRDDGLPSPTPKETAAWKGQQALSLGCFQYVESDHQQAIWIAALFPMMSVIWWNKGTPLQVQSSLVPFS
jgi:hypoxanthine phosphoribosyltransferase